ncbi:hypothetical protein KAR91_28510 [Candidatus Pacearchaeota archaeon]|nr:hypothetical protein [Candidatus Pacearchaeota archaeon]
MFKFNDLVCDHCGEKLESFDDMSITITGTFVCDYCDKRFILMKCDGCGKVFRNRKGNYVWKGEFTNTVYSKKPEVTREPMIKCHNCVGNKISQDFHKYKIHPIPQDAVYQPPAGKKDHSKDLLNGNYEIIKKRERNKTQMKGKRYLQPMVTDYKEGTAL